MKNLLRGVFKIPSTRGGKLRLLGLLAYSVATVVHPPVAAYLAAAAKVLGNVATGQ